SNLGNGSAAFESFRKSAAMLESLVGRSGAPPQVRRDYLRVLNSLAPAYGHRGDWKSEEVTAKKCVDLAEQILKADPNGASAKYDLMMSTGTLADTFSGEGNYAQAATLRERTLELGRQYAALNPGSKEGQRAVAVALKKLAALYGVLKRYDESH